MGHVRVPDAVRSVGREMIVTGRGTNTDHSPSELYPNFAILSFKNSVTYTAVPCSNAHTAELLIFYSRVRTCSRYAAAVSSAFAGGERDACIAHAHARAWGPDIKITILKLYDVRRGAH